MEKERKTKSVAIVALIVAVLGLTVAFAALSQTLTINGKASIGSSSWDIHFTNLQEKVITGDATETTAPSLQSGDTYIGDFAVTLTKPGDSVVYNFDVTNAGSLDAKLSSITISEPTCTSLASVDADATLVCDNLVFTLTYSDGTEIKQNDVLSAADTKQLKLTVGYDSDSNELPSDDVQITNLKAVLVYTQN